MRGRSARMPASKRTKHRRPARAGHSTQSDCADRPWQAGAPSYSTPRSVWWGRQPLWLHRIGHDRPPLGSHIERAEQHIETGRFLVRAADVVGDREHRYVVIAMARGHLIGGEREIAGR